MDTVAGIDVGKNSLVVALDEGRGRRVANTPAGIEALRQWLGARGVTRVVCEPTGGYERAVVQAVQADGVPVLVAHPTRVRAFARAAGTEAKTDRLDAQVLARYGTVMPPAAAPPPDPARDALRDLLGRRQQLVEDRVRDLNRLDKGLTPPREQSVRRHLGWLEQEIPGLEAQVQAALAASPRLTQQVQLYRSVHGVGDLTATILTAYLPELGHASGKALTALVGLAPWARDSGRQRGYRAIRGGRGPVRRALYLAALAAVRHDGSLGRFYRRLRQRGKPGKVALVAVMRKLLLQLNAVARRGTPWTEDFTPSA